MVQIQRIGLSRSIQVFGYKGKEDGLQLYFEEACRGIGKVIKIKEFSGHVTIAFDCKQSE
jgi:hypothetical protein